MAATEPKAEGYFEECYEKQGWRTSHGTGIRMKPAE